jgi:mannobiose 2-epimerase
MNSAVEQLRREALECLTQNILPFWLDNMQDHEHGGWYGRMDGHGTLYAHAEKGAILNARILWSFAAAYRVLRRPEYLQAATRTKDYFLHEVINKDKSPRGNRDDNEAMTMLKEYLDYMPRWTLRGQSHRE